MKIKFRTMVMVTALLFIMPWGCPPPNGTGPRPRPGDDAIETAITELRNADGEQRDVARIRLDALVNQYPDSTLADNALMDIARSYLTEESFDKAIHYLEIVVTRYADSDNASEARFLLGLAFFRKGEMDRAVEEFSKITEKDHRYVDVSIFYIDSQLRLGNFEDAVGRYSKLLKIDPERSKEAEKILLKYMEKMDEKQLVEITEELSASKIGSSAFYMLGLRAYDRGDFTSARDYLTRFLTHGPESDRAAQAREILEDIDSVGEIDAGAIGLLLPLSGKWASYGERFLEGASLAVGAFQPKAGDGDPVRIEVMDTAGDPDTAAAAAESLAVEKRVIAIAGPIQRITSTAAAQVAQSYGVPIVTMTQMEEITDIGEMVFRNSVTPRDQTKTLVWYAVTALGMKNFAVMYPDHSYGRLFSGDFAEEAARHGANVILNLPYKPGQSDFRDQIKEIAKRKREIEAIFIPDSYMAAATIAPQLIYYNVVRVKLLGSSGWNNPKLIQLAMGQESSIEGAVFPDAFFEEAKSPTARVFIDEFEATFGHKPGLYEAMGYETVRILIERIKSGKAVDRIAMREELTGLDNFPSYCGYVSAQPDRSFHHPLFLLEVRKGKIVDISTSGEL